jgi:nucleotide-binding universal stress UspA family protein
MSERNDELAIRRILVALDASYHSLAALEAAAEIAASLEAELQGLFVEDVNLLRAARSPATREVRYPFDAAARLDQARMERALRAQAARARRAIAAACEQRQIKWSFRVVRGEVAREVLAAATEADLLSLGKASRPLIRKVRLGSTARAAAVQGPHCVLLLQRDVRIQAPVMVIYDDSPTARRALALAARLAQKMGRYVDVLLLASATEEVPRLRAEISDVLRGRGLMAQYRQLTKAGATALAQAVRAEGSGVLVLGCTILQPEALQALLSDVDCPVLVVR